MNININKNIGIFLIIIENWLSELYEFISFNNNKSIKWNVINCFLFLMISI